MKVKDLKAKSKVDEITVQILEKQDSRVFSNAAGQGKLCNATVKDEDDDETTLTLWNDDVDKYNVDDIITIKNGWVSEYKGKIQISTGKNGTIELVKQ